MAQLPNIMVAMEQQEAECLQKYQNLSIEGLYCEAAWDSFLCWPPAAPGEILFRPCPLLDSIGTIVGESSHPDMLARRSCGDNGIWLGNFTNFTLCVSDMEELYPNSWTPMAIALIVIIGSSLSIITLIISLFIFFYFKSLKCSRLKVHCNLSIALLLHLLLLIVSSSPILTNSSYKHTEWICKSILTLQMYSALASINWMFVEGLLLHSRVTVHIFKKDAPFKLYYCIGWGFPALCIGLWGTLMSYYHNSHCWSGYGGQQYIWLITGPMIAALLVNTIFLVDIIRILVTKRLVKRTAETAHVRKAVKATALLFPLLGMPHLLFCINPKDNGTLEEAYMIFNAFVKSSQGLFVSVLYCFMNADVQMALKKAYMRTLSQRYADCPSKCRRVLSQTSGSYMSSQSEVTSSQPDGGRKKRPPVKASRPPAKAVLRLQEVQESPNNSVKKETVTLIF